MQPNSTRGPGEQAAPVGQSPADAGPERSSGPDEAFGDRAVGLDDSPDLDEADARAAVDDEIVVAGTFVGLEDGEDEDLLSRLDELDDETDGRGWDDLVDTIELADFDGEDGGLDDSYGGLDGRDGGLDSRDHAPDGRDHADDPLILDLRPASRGRVDGDGRATARPGPAGGRPAGIWDDTTARGYRERVLLAQIRFVDDPRGAVDQMRSMTTEVLHRLSMAMVTAPGDLDAPDPAGGMDTERMRTLMCRYRDFLLHALAI